jgi:hypothetical protein
MNAKDAENKQLEELLKKAYLSGPSLQLKHQIIIGAKKAWNQTGVELSWLVPFRRLVASAAAAIIIIWLANYYSDCALAQWQSDKFPSVTKQSPGLESLLEIPYGSFVRSMVSINRRPSPIDTSALSDHAEALRHILDEAQQNRIARPSARPGGRSHLISSPANTNSYS